MKCHKCQTENPADNKFCRECGMAIAPPDAAPSREEVMRRQARVAELLTDALRLRDKGLYKEALPFAEEASRLMPESTRALAMLTSLYEHQGRWDRAILAMERLVALTPDSIADQEQLAELRRKAHQPVHLTVAKPLAEKERTPALPSWLMMVLAGGVAAVVFFSCLPLFVHHTPAPSSLATSSEATPSPIPVPSFDPVTPLKEALSQPNEGPVDPFVRQRQAATPAPVDTGNPDVTGLPDPTARANRSQVARAPRNAPTPIPFLSVPTMPVTPPNGAEDGNAPNSGANDNTDNDGADGNGFGNGGRLAVRPPSGGSINSAIPAAPPPSGDNGSQSYIYIKVHPAPVSHGKDEPNNGAQDHSSSSNNAQSSADTTGPATNQDMDRARYLQGSGHYAEAIRAYQNVLSGGVRGDVYQGIAQSYQRMGDTESARASYKDAIHAYEQERPTQPRLAQQGIASCEAALVLLGG
jgi:tetratricopeptide (TPR) repeat protein